MKIGKYRNQLLIIMLAVGFFVGVLYQNVVAKQFGVSIQIFQSYFLNQYKQTKFVAEEYIWYVLKARLWPFVMLMLLWKLKWKKTISCLMCLGTGFLLGMLMVASLMQLGLKGILLCLGGMLPHMIFYVLAYSVLLLYFYHYPRRIWSPVKSIFVVLMMVLGMVTETYLNPYFVKWIIGGF